MVIEQYCGNIPRITLEKIGDFLKNQGIERDAGVTFYAVAYDEFGEIAACGGLEKNILKCIATSEKHRGEGCSAAIVTALCARAYKSGEKSLLLFTKPKNSAMFLEFGFSPIVATRDMLLMENPTQTLTKFIASLEGGKPNAGAVVMNCNPFTLGHRYLIETAAARCQTLHIFVLSEEKSMFSASERTELVRRGTADLQNVIIHPTSDYMVSAATFPTYFIKDAEIKNRAGGELDLEIFGSYFAPALDIKTRFVGEEPLSPITALYNRQMHEILPKFGIEVVEIPRKTVGDEVISASRVRALLVKGNFEEISKLVPKTTLEFLQSTRR